MKRLRSRSKGAHEKRSPADTADNRLTFHEVMSREADIAYIPEGQGAQLEPLADMDYADECAAKEKGFQRFLSAYHLDLPVEPLVQSPLPRGYRTTTKRKPIIEKRVFRLAADAGRNILYHSKLEPDSHRTVYDQLEQTLAGREYTGLVRHINFLIIRESNGLPLLIWNLDALSGDIVRAVTKISELLNVQTRNLAGAYIFHDPTRSRYYLESDSAASGSFRIKRIFGAHNLSTTIRGIRYTYPVDSFSQVNTGIAERIIDRIAHSFDGGSKRLLDLYCGYGLFSCSLGLSYKEVAGMDLSRGSVQAAVENVRHVKSFPPSKFYVRRIDLPAIRALLPKDGADEHCVIDPPRKGSAPGVIESFPARNISHVAHLFCGIDTIPSEISRYKQSGFSVKQVTPFDMFAGTTSIEALVIFQKQ